MKRESEESRKRLPMGPGSADIYDFLYVDRSRISALYAQLFPQGILTSVKTTAQQSFTDESDLGTDVKVIKAEAKSVEGGSEGIEHLFDASWSIPLEVMAQLQKLSRMRDSLKGAGLGSIVLTECFLRVIDFTSLENLWEPAMKIALGGGTPPPGLMPEMVSTFSDALKNMPRTIHAHFLASDGFLWSSLQPENLTISVVDLTLKYGGTVSGRWNLLYILDAWADSGEPPDVSTWSGGQMIDSILTAMHGLRGIMGRPSNWFGITPLMIFRNTAGWTPSVSDSKQSLP